MLSEDRLVACSNFFENKDPWFQTLQKLRVSTDVSNPHQFKCSMVAALRNGDVYKALKPIKKEDVESNLLESGDLSPAAFVALAMHFKLDVAVGFGRIVLVLPGTPRFLACSGGKVTALPDSGMADFVEIRSIGKPLYAISHYSHGDLFAMATVLRTKKGSKQMMYEGISEYVQRRLV
jgi:hypothetical protein